ncbi:hypothetical protein GCM10010277_77720 [Streptomyces longisporoflavus]|nr:hypothetical protein GCM10010277_77720 [Streptomyces longisporoflavus]
MGRRRAFRADFVVVVDQRQLAVLVALEAVIGKSADLRGPAAGVDDQLDSGADLGGSGGFEAVEVLAELCHHLGRQVLAGLVVLGVVRNVVGLQAEGLADPVQGLIALGQAQGPHPAQQSPGVSDHADVRVSAELVLFVQEPQPVQEDRHVDARDGANVLAVVGPVQPQAVRELDDRVDVGLDGRAALAPPLGNVVQGPGLRGLPQPGLADLVEVDVAVQAERVAGPDVLVPLGLGGQAEAAEVLEEARGDVLRLMVEGAQVELGERGDLLGANTVAERSQEVVLLHHALSHAFLQAVEDLVHHSIG